jgi:hypothetical protein
MAARRNILDHVVLLTDHLQQEFMSLSGVGTLWAWDIAGDITSVLVLNGHDLENYFDTYYSRLHDRFIPPLSNESARPPSRAAMRTVLEWWMRG